MMPMVWKNNPIFKIAYDPGSEKKRIGQGTATSCGTSWPMITTTCVGAFAWVNMTACACAWVDDDQPARRGRLFEAQRFETCQTHGQTVCAGNIASPFLLTEHISSACKKAGCLCLLLFEEVGILPFLKRRGRPTNCPEKTTSYQSEIWSSALIVSFAVSLINGGSQNSGAQGQ